MYGSDSWRLAMCYCSVAELHRAQGDMALALALYQKAMMIGEKVLGRRHIQPILYLPDLRYRKLGIGLSVWRKPLIWGPTTPPLNRWVGGWGEGGLWGRSTPPSNRWVGEGGDSGAQTLPHRMVGWVGSGQAKDIIGNDVT